MADDGKKSYAWAWITGGVVLFIGGIIALYFWWYKPMEDKKKLTPKAPAPQIPAASSVQTPAQTNQGSQ